MKTKTLVILAHPNIGKSSANKRWREELLKYPEEIEVHELYKEYPDWNINIKKEQELLEKYNHIILQFPLYWFNCPPLLKKWLDDVFEHNWAYGTNGNKLKDKKIGLAVTTGSKKECYSHGGENRFTLDELLIPFETTINYVKANYLPYFTIYGVSPHLERLNKEEKDKKKKNIELKGDLKLHENLFELEKEFNIYIGKLKSKGFGKVKVKIEEYKESNEKSIENRIEELNSKIKEREEGENGYIICFDLQSDIVLPFQDIYNAGEQFLILSGLEDKNIRFNSRRSFINTGKLSGYNIINDIRKVDELIFCRGSVFAYSIDKTSEDYKNILKTFTYIERNGLGLRKNEGFGRIKICSIRSEEKEEILKKEKELDKNIIKKEFEEKHINNKKFQEAVKVISLSQISRFYSILESRNFSSSSKIVEEFVDRQLKKIEGSDGEHPLNKAKLFFEYFKENFLTEEFLKENERNKIQFELIRACVRYYIGIKRIEEKLKQGDEE